MTQWGNGFWGTGQWGTPPQPLDPPVCSGAGNWGQGTWGCGPWGGGGVSPPPVVGAVQGALCDTRGGTVLGVFGINFVDPTLVEIIDPGGLEVLGEAVYFEASLDLRRNKVLAGFPALPAGTYGLRITTPFGTSPVLLDAVTYVPFADEGKVQRVRRSFAEAWATGERILR